MEHAWRTGDMAASGPADTIADGIAARVPVPSAIHEMRRLVDDFHLIDDAAIVAAMRYLYLEHALVSEPAGAAGLAVALALARRLDGALIAAPVCGSNIAPHLFARYISAADHASQIPPARQEQGQT
jgi:threonine dehydratase